MVWGLVDNYGFGQYFPGGDYVGWEEQLLAYYNSGMTDAEKDEIGVPPENARGETLVSKTANKFTEDLGPLSPHQQPVEFLARKNWPSLASLIELNSCLLAVDEGLKAVIEEFEPGLHQFWPIRIKMPRGDYPVTYYGIVIRQLRDSCLPEQCQLAPQSDDPQSDNAMFFAKSYSKKDYAALTLSGAEIGTAHLWRERRLRRPNIFMSDALQAAIKDNGLKIYKHYPLKVV